jgi:hypothetical protein
MLSPRSDHTATRLPDGRVLVAGGLVNDRLDGQRLAAAELYDPRDGTWTATGAMTEKRFGHSATLLANGRVLVAGGYLGSGLGYLDTAELYEPATGKWMATGSMTASRGGHSATLLPNGTVLVVGGAGDDDTMEGGPRSATAELYDPVSGRWTATGSMTNGRMGFTTTLLPDGTVLAAGGDGTFVTAEHYDPATGRWTATSPMAEGRFGHTATLLPDGRVLVTGGCACSDPGAVATAELYDPAVGSWTSTAPMGASHIFHAATLLADGTVLIVDGGLRDDDAPSAERYEPASRAWSPAASPAKSRYGFTTTLLGGGTVLLAGDYDDASLAITEVYDPASGS